MNYFDKLPTINYNGHTVKNILAKATLSNPSKNNKLLFYPYTMKEGERVDQISNYYYDNPGYTWLIWLTNNIVDPYYDMPLSINDLNKHIAVKYGSAEAAMRKVKCYRNNWYSYADSYSLEYYNSLYYKFKKYFDPIVGSDYEIIGYKRKRHDDLVATNMTIDMTVSTTVGLKKGEEVYLGNNYGFITHVSDVYVTINNITGSFTEGDVLSGKESNVSFTILNINTTIPTVAYEEAEYWEQVSFYDYEHELNEAKKIIKLLDARYKSQAEANLKNLLSSV